MSMAYVVACYFGPRRVHDPIYEKCPWVYIQEHVYQLSKLEHSFDQIVFAINDDSGYVPHIPDQIKGIPVEIVVRPNIGMSYGAWNYAMTNIPEFDYYFLIEDDYIPVCDNFDQIFMDEFRNDTTAYVCSLYQHEHAAITNGLVKASAVEATGGILFAPSDHYGANEAIGQVGWSRILNREGYGIEHIAPKYSVPFLDANGGIIYYGVTGGEKVISPVMLERGKL